MKLSEWLENHITLHTHDNPQQEFYNFLTHFAGAVLSIIALILMIIKSISNNGNNLAGVVIFGLSMTLLYSASSVYHRVKHSNLKRILRIMDHSNIYFLIAGTYTPIALFMNNEAGNRIAITIWSIAFSGIVFTLVFWGKLKPLHVAIYLFMGWIAVFFWKDLKQILPFNFIKWTIAGGITYTIGVIFYALKKLPFYHPIWHVFVVGGSACFFFGVYNFLI
ncbi:MAG: hemolysin III family protein [Spirochaetes bacterium]|nr:hemolysin III family protein [Spirochaetota bacterium]